jgi:hypothetical protein
MQKKLYKRQRIDLILFEYVYCTTVYSLVWIDGISSGFFLKRINSYWKIDAYQIFNWKWGCHQNPYGIEI